MDALQFAREAVKKATIDFPDIETWTDAHWAVYCEFSDRVPTITNYECICRGVVTRVEGGAWTYVDMVLDPPPRHPFLPKTIRIIAKHRQHSADDFHKLQNLALGERAEIKGLLREPGGFVENGVWEYWFILKETNSFRRSIGFTGSDARHH